MSVPRSSRTATGTNTSPIGSPLCWVSTEHDDLCHGAGSSSEYPSVLAKRPLADDGGADAALAVTLAEAEADGVGEAVAALALAVGDGEGVAAPRGETRLTTTIAATTAAAAAASAARRVRCIGMHAATAMPLPSILPC